MGSVLERGNDRFELAARARGLVRGPVVRFETRHHVRAFLRDVARRGRPLFALRRVLGDAGVAAYMLSDDQVLSAVEEGLATGRLEVRAWPRGRIPKFRELPVETPPIDDEPLPEKPAKILRGRARGDTVTPRLAAASKTKPSHGSLVLRPSVVKQEAPKLGGAARVPRTRGASVSGGTKARSVPAAVRGKTRTPTLPDGFDEGQEDMGPPEENERP